MTKILLMIAVSGLGIGLAVNPATTIINPYLFKGTGWFLSGILRMLK
jgi:hypothetical protein